MINDQLLLESLHKFYEKEYNRDKLFLILSDEKSISLRSIDWFITNYSKKNNTYYIIYEDNDGKRDRLLFKIDDKYSIETTIGQLNFFKWAISNLIIDYIEINKQDIENDMNSSLKQMKINHNKKNGSRKKRQELSLSATRGLSMNHVPIEITFD